MRGMRVFISSVHREFEKERRSIEAALSASGYEVLLSRTIHSHDQIRPTIEAELKRADLVICLLGSEWGSPAGGGGEKGASVTQLEMQLASAQQIPSFYFVKSCPGGRHPAMEEFIAGIGDFSEGTWHQPFAGEDDLVDLVRECVRRFEEREYVDSAHGEPNLAVLESYRECLRECLKKEQYAYHLGEILDREGTRETGRLDATHAGYIDLDFRVRKTCRAKRPGAGRTQDRLTGTGTGRQRKIPDITRFLRDQALEVTALKGEPGAGKTTAMRHIALQLLKQRNDPASDDFMLPVYLRLQRYESRTPFGDPGPFMSFLWREVEDRMGRIGRDDFLELRRSLTKLIDDGKILFLFDALDEMPLSDSKQRYKVVRSFADDFVQSGCRVVVSCRERNYDRNFNAQEILLRALDRKRIIRMVRQGVCDPLKVHVPSIVGAILNPEGNLTVPCQNPFFLKMVLLYLDCVARECGYDFEKIQEEIGALEAGASSNRLFDAVVQWQFQNARRRKTLLLDDPALFRSVLGELAIGRFRNRNAPVEDLMRIFPQHGRDAIEQVLGAAEDENIIHLDPAGDQFAFGHYRLQEYFAACRFAESGERPDKSLGLPLDAPGLEEILVVYAGLTRELPDLLDSILEEADPREGVGEFWNERRAVLLLCLAARCLADRPTEGERYRAAVARRLREVLESGNSLARIEAIDGLRNVLSEPEFNLVLANHQDESSWVNETLLARLQASTLSLRQYFKALILALARIESPTRLLLVAISSWRHGYSSRARILSGMSFFFFLSRLLMVLGMISVPALFVVFRMNRRDPMGGYPIENYLINVACAELTLLLVWLLVSRREIWTLWRSLLAASGITCLLVLLFLWGNPLPDKASRLAASGHTGSNEKLVGSIPEFEVGRWLILAGVLALLLLMLFKVRIGTRTAVEGEDHPLPGFWREILLHWWFVAPPFLLTLFVTIYIIKSIRWAAQSFPTGFVMGGLTVLFLTVGGANRMKEYQRYRRLIEAIWSDPSGSVGLVILEYLQEERPEKYKRGACLLMEMIETPTSALLEGIWGLQGRDWAGIGTKDALWRSYRELERRFRKTGQEVAA